MFCSYSKCLCLFESFQPISSPYSVCLHLQQPENMKHGPHTLSLFLFLSQTHKTKTKLCVQSSAVVAPCVGRLRLCGETWSPWQTPLRWEWMRWQEHRRGTYTIQLIMFIWVWVTSTRDCRSISSMVFCISPVEAASGSRASPCDHTRLRFGWRWRNKLGLT